MKQQACKLDDEIRRQTPASLPRSEVSGCLAGALKACREARTVLQEDCNDLGDALRRGLKTGPLVIH